MAQRLRGRAGMAQRLRRLRNEPLCRDCMAQGKVTAASVPDHIVPLSKGGSDDDDNIRCICSSCHARRTTEQFGHRLKKVIGVDGWPQDG